MEQEKFLVKRPPHSTEGIQITVAGPGGTTLPSGFVGHVVQVRCVSGSCRILFGGPAVAVAIAAASGAADFGYLMAAGEKEDFDLAQNDVRIAYDGAAAVIDIWLRSGQGRR
jgi:hypothetical protein